VYDGIYWWPISVGLKIGAGIKCPKTKIRRRTIVVTRKGSFAVSNGAQKETFIRIKDRCTIEF